MNRVHVVFVYLTALLMLAAMTGLVGCSQGNGSANGVTVPGLSGNSPPASPSGDSVALGYFQFVWGDDGTVSVEEIQAVRGAEINVTNYASIVIEDFYFKEDERNWYVIATIKNISPFTGYDVWAVFHSMGNKFLVNQDGFTWALPPIFPNPTRCPFIAYGKGQPGRVYPPMFQDTRTIIIHQPEGVPKLAPIGFWIDAKLKNRTTPGVEDLKVEAVNATDYHLTGFIWDHQSPSKDLSVWADCTPFNGVNYVQLFDDGLHGDGAANDKIFGGDFSGDPADGKYTITVFAFDPQQNKGENDVRFLHGDEVPCDLPIEQLKFETIDIGEHSGIQFEKTAVVNDWPAWEALWKEHTGIYMPPPPIPPVDFMKNTVIGVWIGERPSNNHIARIYDVQFDPCEELVTVFYKYTPYTACGPLDVMTAPFHIIVLPKIPWDVYFVGKEIPCPGPPPECVKQISFEKLQQGVHSAIKDPYEKHITTKDKFVELWNLHTANMDPKPPVPEVNFVKYDVIAVAVGNRSTGGFECIIEKICWLDNQQVGVYYKERIPGPNCVVPMVFTQPFHWVVVPKFVAPVNFYKTNEVYSCGQGGCEKPQIFTPIDEGTMTGHTAGEFVFKTMAAFHQFWVVHKPGQPLPPINWEKNMVLAMLIGDRPSSGYSVNTIEVCINGNGAPGGPWMDVRYVENVPGPDCVVLHVITQPYQIIVVPKFDGPVNFHHEKKVYDCPPCKEIPWYQLADDKHSCAEEGNYGFQGFNDDFEKLWHLLYCYEPPALPEIPKPIDPANEMKPFVVQLGERPTSGYYVTIDKVCFEGCTVTIDYTEWIPAQNCVTLPVVTKPWAFGVAEFPPIDCQIQYKFNGNKAIYECPDDECTDVPFLQNAHGKKGCAEPQATGFQHLEPYKSFWWAVNCYDPGSGKPPPELPKDPDPIQGGIMYHLGIQLGERPSTGYYINVDKVCIIGCDVYVDYTEYIPGKNCNVLWVITKPWAVAAVELPPVYCQWTWHFTKYEKIYDCD